MTLPIHSRANRLGVLQRSAALALAIWGAGCSSGGSIAAGSLAQTVKSAWPGFRTPPIGRADVEAVPFASIGYRVGDDAEEMIVLAGREGNDLVWTSSAKITLVTRNGRIVRSIGLQHDLRDMMQMPAPDQKDPASFTRTVRFDDPEDVTALVSCRIKTTGTETISILERNILTTVMQEDCWSSQLRWRFQNLFWVDPQNGLTWRSRQSINPKLKPVTAELLRPYSIEAAKAD